MEIYTSHRKKQNKTQMVCLWVRQRRKERETERKEIPNLEGAEMEGESNNSLP